MKYREILVVVSFIAFLLFLVNSSSVLAGPCLPRKAINPLTQKKIEYIPCDERGNFNPPKGYIDYQDYVNNKKMDLSIRYLRYFGILVVIFIPILFYIIRIKKISR
ncbi:MAG: hypothetical protein ACD_24C00403G0002 [uncultured bacterium]|uniref:Uncharacterized protein n=1 Tax=Candidatus Woesebacteria bacterium GW2011_GWA1_37_8 TaxID=1618546 RepID=A0A0G0KYP9_9BACT|nr:MAG: hypothetical protein ACD_24C00403G0002 [uncultured bacterium]KKQ23937.1 MAG: hypothetical protein US39_C0021G0008 [Microgenomates group bacterium GW2011_GWC1_37_12b]KKQ45606.1 MAG: hypothetical protein US62_C0012G0020 [Candidatus Woesebacteria bacterium GW2011_GWA1_37_8]